MEAPNLDYFNENVAYSSLREINCTIHWFKCWNQHQRSCFMTDLVSKAVPSKVDLLLDGLSGMTMNDKPPSLFECQLRLFNQWFQEWDQNERDFMLQRLEAADPIFVAEFRQNVKNAAGS